MLRKLIQAAAIIALLSGTAAAQFMPGIPLNADKPPPTPEEIEKQKAIDRAYRSAAGKIPDKKPVVDPWANIRTAPATATKNKQQ